MTQEQYQPHTIRGIICSTCQREETFSVTTVHPVMVQTERGSGLQYWEPQDNYFRGFISCGNCHNLQLVEFKVKPAFAQRVLQSKNTGMDRMLDYLLGYRTVSHQNKLQLGHGIELRSGLDELDCFPKVPKFEAPKGAPAEISSLFGELNELRESPRYQIAHCRQIMEKICSEYLKPSKESLAKRIDKLVEAKRLPESMGAWAHRVREFGNKAVHQSEKPSQEDAREVRRFTELMLEILYTIPAEIGEFPSSKAPNSEE